MTIAFDDAESSYYKPSESHPVNKAYAFPLKRCQNFMRYLAQCVNFREFLRMSCVSVLFSK